MLGPLLHRVLSDAFLRPHNTTADLYFANVMAGHQALRRLAPTVWESDKAVAVLRHDLGARVDARMLDGRDLVYLIDDDITAAVRDPSLSPGFRAKLALVEGLAWRRLRRLSPSLAVSGPFLRDRLGAAHGSMACQIITPHWTERPSTLAQFDDDRPLRIGYLGSRAHRGDLALVTEILKPVIAARPDVEICLAANHRLPDWLASYAGLRPITATAWPDYRRGLPDLGCHLLIYPLMDTPMNRARSINKLIEHGIAGGAGLYPAAWPSAAEITHDEDGLLLPPDPESWSAAVLDLLETPERMRALARAGQDLACRLNEDNQSVFWSERMLG
ncbi:MAG: hypothetical protein AAFR17_15430 [Pseudomonadota bacterium]